MDREAIPHQIHFILEGKSLNKKGKPLLIPVRLANYHKQQLVDPATGEVLKINTSVTLNRRKDRWWLTLIYDQQVSKPSTSTAPVIGIDIGIANFLTTSDGQQFGSIDQTLRNRLRLDREKPSFESVCFSWV